MIEKALQFQEKNKERFLRELCELLKIPSISAIPEYNKDCIRCAEAVKYYLEGAGAKVEIFPTKGLPIVYGEKIIDKKKPTVLIYGHYDVQPVDPLELWKTPPFEPTIKNNKIYARGSADDKGQFFMHLKVLESLTKTDTLPLNMKFIIEGEEEVGSGNMEDFLKKNKKLLKADTVLVSDTAMLSNKNPSIDTGLRGLSYIEVEVRGPNRDLHSGVYGGAVANPVTILAKIIAKLHDKNNKVTIPGFYKDVVTLSPKERDLLNSVPFDLSDFKKDLDIREEWGEKGFTTIERTGIRPTLELNGIWGGYTGDGAKTVLPSKAYAKISCRLVPNQEPKKIEKLLADHIRKIAPDNVVVRITYHHGGRPYVMPVENIAYKAAELAVKQTFGKKPIPIRGGGSIPVVADFEKYLGIKTLLLGFGLNDDNLHSPNEKYNLTNFYKGIETITHFHKHFAMCYF